MRTALVPFSTGRDMPPMLELNTTPLIDVLLVLLVMLIITIPMQSHALKLDLPQPEPTVSIDRVHDEVVIARPGALSWNDQSISRGQLTAVLAQVSQMREPPEVHIRPDPDARYEVVDDVLAIARRAHIDALGFVGNERYAGFKPLRQR